MTTSVNWPRRRAGLGCLVVALVVILFGYPATAAAVPPPTVDPAALGIAKALSRNPAPLEPTEQRAVCAEPVLTGGAVRTAPIAQRVLNLPAAWQFSRGAGQKVAVIDTGVNRHPRLPALQAGGDFVSDTDGTVDCDGHGTLVAGIIAARQSPDDAFAGVAPEAEILAIRQLSLAYEKQEHAGAPVPGAIADSGYGNVLTLAAAVVRAVDLGATVINISEVSCAGAGTDTTDDALGAAVQYAYQRDVVVVAAAGNVGSGGTCDVQNERPGWAAVQTVVSPAWFARYVLSVAAIDPDGSPAALSMHGPWVGVAAVGSQIVSLDSKPGGTGLVDGVQTTDGVRAIEGTSFATAYVAGLAALVRARFPNLNAQQVIHRIKATAHAPGTGRNDQIGHGLIDPVAALTAQLPKQPISADRTVPRAITLPEPPAPPDPLPRRIAIIGSISCLLALGIGSAFAFPFRRRTAVDSELDLDELEQ